LNQKDGRQAGQRTEVCDRQGGGNLRVHSMRTVRHVSRAALSKAERTAVSISDLIQKLPVTVCEDYFFEVTKSGSSVKVRTLLKNKPMTVVSLRYPKMVLKYT